MTLWGKQFKRIPDEWRQAFLSRPVRPKDATAAFDQIWVMKWIIGALGTLVSAQGVVSWWLFKHLWDCLHSAQSATALLR